MKFLFLVGLLSTATSLPIPLEQFGGSSSEQRFNFFPPPIPPFLPQFPFPPAPQPPLIPFPFPFPNNPNQVILTLNDLIVLITAILNQLGGFFGISPNKLSWGENYVNIFNNALVKSDGAGYLQLSEDDLFLSYLLLMLIVVSPFCILCKMFQ